MPRFAVPVPVLEAADLRRANLRAVGRAGRVWVVDADGRRLVLRRCNEKVARWLHPCLASLAAEFPVPRPAPVFAGSAIFGVDGDSWEALTYLPGHEVGWDDRPSLELIGEFLAAFHNVSLRVTADYVPRPGGTRLVDLSHLVDRQGAVTTMGSNEGAEHLLVLLDRFAAEIEEIGYRTLPGCVIHGDPTTFNVLADGNPPTPVGLVDFELADVEAAVADIAFCLWRSGRPRQHAYELEVGRVRALLDGYRGVRPLTDAELAAIAVCLRGRGLQMLVKRTRTHLADAHPLAQLQWLGVHAEEVVAAAT